LNHLRELEEIWPVVRSHVTESAGASATGMVSTALSLSRTSSDMTALRSRPLSMGQDLFAAGISLRRWLS
jgi:hypothetical protein